jgi:hypothetical protein
VLIFFHSGFSLLKNLRKSLSWSKTQRAVANRASDSLSTETLADWSAMRKKFDQDRTKPNPYEEPETCKLFALRLVFPKANNPYGCHDGISESPA